MCQATKGGNCWRDMYAQVNTDAGRASWTPRWVLPGNRHDATRAPALLRSEKAYESPLEDEERGRYLGKREVLCANDLRNWPVQRGRTTKVSAGEGEPSFQVVSLIRLPCTSSKPVEWHSLNTNRGFPRWLLPDRLTLKCFFG